MSLNYRVAFLKNICSWVRYEMSLGVTVITPPHEYDLFFSRIHSTHEDGAQHPLGRHSARPLNFSA